MDTEWRHKLIRIGSKLLSQQIFSIVLISAGLFLLVAVASYYSYAALARSKLDSLNYTIEKPTARDVDDSVWQLDGVTRSTRYDDWTISEDVGAYKDRSDDSSIDVANLSEEAYH